MLHESKRRLSSPPQLKVTLALVLFLCSACSSSPTSLSHQLDASYSTETLSAWGSVESSAVYSTTAGGQFRAPRVGVSESAMTANVTASQMGVNSSYEVWDSAVGFSVYSLFDADFRIAAQRENWDRTERVELSFYSREPLHGRVEALIGGHLYREERDWNEGDQRVIVDAWGFGLDMGAMIYPFPNADEREFNIGLVPFVRFGIGLSDGDFRNIDVNLPGEVGSSSGELGEYRYDFGLGAEVRALIGRTFYFGLGAGYNWWTTADGSAGTTRNGVDIIVIQDDKFDFKGSEGYLRATVGFYF